jgi:hypothetical protein
MDTDKKAMEQHFAQMAQHHDLVSTGRHAFHRLSVSLRTTILKSFRSLRKFLVRTQNCIFPRIPRIPRFSLVAALPRCVNPWFSTALFGLQAVA